MQLNLTALEFLFVNVYLLRVLVCFRLHLCRITVNKHNKNCKCPEDGLLAAASAGVWTGPARDSFTTNRERKKENSLLKKISGRPSAVGGGRRAASDTFFSASALTPGVSPELLRSYHEARRPPSSIIHCRRRDFIQLIKETVLIANQALLKNYLHQPARYHPSSPCSAL